MKKHYQNPKMNLVEIDEWQSVICTSPDPTDGITNSGYGKNTGGGFNQGNSAPSRRDPWDE